MKMTQDKTRSTAKNAEAGVPNSCLKNKGTFKPLVTKNEMKK